LLFEMFSNTALPAKTTLNTWKWVGKICRMTLTVEYRHTRRCTWSSTILSTTNFQWNGLGLNSRLRVKSEKSEGTFLYNVPRFTKQHNFLDASYVIQLRATCTWRLVCSPGGTILTGENRSTRKKKRPVSGPLYPPQISHGVTQDQTQASAVKGRQVSAWTMIRSPKLKWIYIT
jgi:hypothetical protein